MTRFALAIAMLALVAPAGAQTKPVTQKPAAPKPTATPAPRPNFTGRWVVVSPPKGAGQEQIVQHDDKSLSTQHASEGADHRQTYLLDGLEHKNVLPTHGMEITITYKAVWDNARIVITSQTSYPNGMRTSATETWSMDPQGRMVVDYAERGPGGGPGPVERIVYSRKQ